MKTLPLAYIRSQFESFGYIVVTNRVDEMGRKWKYITMPLVAGSHGHFNNKEELLWYLNQVKFIRELN